MKAIKVSRDWFAELFTPGVLNDRILTITNGLPAGSKLVYFNIVDFGHFIEFHFECPGDELGAMEEVRPLVHLELKEHDQ